MARKSHAPGPYVVVRTYSAGCFAGHLARRQGREVTLTDVRRLWRWEGAATLSELATRGTSAPESCKFPPPAPRILILEAIEILDTTEAAEASIKGVPAWTLH